MMIMMLHGFTPPFTNIHHQHPSANPKGRGIGSDPPILRSARVEDYWLHAVMFRSTGITARVPWIFHSTTWILHLSKGTSCFQAEIGGAYEISGAAKRDGEVTFSAKRKQPCGYSGIDTNILAILASRIRVCRLVLEIE